MKANSECKTSPDLLYHRFEQIGAGSFGRVFKGRKKNSGLVCALKFIEKVNKTESQLEKLRNEIEIITSLEHQNVVRCFESYETETEFCVVMEYLSGGDLMQILEVDNSLPFRQVQKIAFHLITGLKYLHQKAIIHRDLKPQNILISNDGSVKLGDFGFAKLLNRTSMVMTSLKGTPLYMAPELYRGREYNYKIDFWSLGCILFEISVGKPPFYTHDFIKLMNLVVKDTIYFPKNMEKTLVNFLKGLLRKDPKNRFNWEDVMNHPFYERACELEEMESNKKRKEIGRVSFFLDPSKFNINEMEYHVITPESSREYSTEIDKKEIDNEEIEESLEASKEIEKLSKLLKKQLKGIKEHKASSLEKIEIFNSSSSENDKKEEKKTINNEFSGEIEVYRNKKRRRRKKKKGIKKS